MQFGRRKIVGLLILSVLAAMVWFRPLDTRAEEYAEAGLKRAFATFAAARTMNAAISVIQSGSVNLQVGAGASLQLGAVLDPLDDLIEQFSALMLAATLSFATQRLLIEVAGAWQVSLVLSVLFVAWGVFRLVDKAPPRLLPKVALGLLCLHLAAPVAALGSELTYRYFLADKYEASRAEIERPDFSNVESQAGGGLVQSIKQWWSRTVEKADVEKKIEELKAKAEKWIEHIVRLAAVFIVQTAILPLLFLWGMFRLYRIVSAPYRGVP
jgi:hypothetical protein